ncbi:DUF2634 domain-containing protein [Weissella muntiaci]|uniref:DUF2634 domain-containing protein n=1 Tax=Weissella muntiaci TaxID=2508881 RepID=A0A6C2C7F3_9LACO|nr:DUF2634 domain-containing protein [Weissella muntiaci]TYC49888.1 DUF2634 domain-containing protein [Weissella muntiaci]
MKDFKVNQDGDLTLFQDIVTVEDSEQIKQSVYIILKTHLGEMPFEPNFGLSWSNIFVKRVVPDYILQDIKTAILTTSTIISSVGDFKFTQDRKTRALTVSFTLSLVNSTNIETEVVLNAG